MLRGDDVKSGHMCNSNKEACKTSTLHLLVVKILCKPLPYLDPGVCKNLSLPRKPLQDFVPDKQAPKLHDKPHLQDLGPLWLCCLLNSVNSTSVNVLSHWGSTMSQIGL